MTATAAKARMDGILDWLKGALRRAAPPVPGLLAPKEAPPGLPAPSPKGLIPAPPREALPSIFEAFGPPAARPMPRETPLIFQVFPPTLPAEIPSPGELLPEIWETMFPTPTEAAPELPAVEMFAPFAAPAETVAPIWWTKIIPETSREIALYADPTDWIREHPDIAERTGGRIPLWITRGATWAVPHTMRVAEAVRMTWDLPMIFEEALKAAEDPFWQETVDHSSHTGEPAELELQEIGRQGDPYGDIARFFGIPENLIEAYGRQYEGDEMFWQEVLGPLLDRFTKAMEYLKPPPLRGWFEIGPAHDRSWQLKYKEARFSPRT